MSTKSDEYRLRIKKLPAINTLVIEKLDKNDQFFVTNERSIAISVTSLSTLISYLVMTGYISHKILEGILEEYYGNHSN